MTTRTHQCSVIVGGCAVVLFFSASLHAQSPTSDIQKSTETQSRALFRVGVTQAKKGDYVRARASFTAAYALHPTVKTLVNVAIAEVGSGAYAEGARHWRACLRIATDPNVIETVRLAIAEVEPFVGRVAIDDGVDSVSSLVIDGERASSSLDIHEPIDVMPGSHVFELSTSTAHVRREIAVAKGEMVHVDFREPVAAIPAIVPVPLKTSDTSRPQTTLTTKATTLPSRVEHDELRSGFWTAPRIAGFSFGAAGAIAIGSAIYFGVRARGDTTDIAGLSLHGDPCATGTRFAACTERSQAKSRHDSNVDAANVALTAGIVLSGAALTAFLWPTSTTSARPTVSLLPGDVRVGVSASF